MTVALLLIIICISAGVVRVGAFALELTGMSWDQAKFQALSAFSTTGYTTRDAEQVVAHPMRRRIISTMIVLGNAGIVTAIGSFAGTMSKDDPVELGISAAVLVVGLMLLFAIVRHDGLTGRLRRRVQAYLQKRYDFAPPRPDQLLRLDEGYGLTRIEIDERSPVLGRTLAELRLNDWRVQVLAIERGGTFQPVPGGQDRLIVGDSIVVYGAEAAITKVFAPRTRTRLTIIGEGGLAIAPMAQPQGAPTAEVAQAATMLASSSPDGPTVAIVQNPQSRAYVAPPVASSEPAATSSAAAPDAGPSSASGRGKYAPVWRP